MKITMFGTGNAMVTECYNTCFMLSDRDDYFLIDGGGGNTILRQLKETGYDCMDIHEIFVTHKHIDHLLGIIWVVRKICQSGGKTQHILGREVTFFDIHSTKDKQFGFCMKLDNGEKLTCCGDEPYNPCMRAYVENSAWLLHEAFCLYAQADIFSPYEKHHSTVKDACETAEELGVKNLILYHTEDRNLPDRKRLYTEEGSRYFHGKLYIPEDLECILI